MTKKDYLLRIPEGLHKELKINSVIAGKTMLDFILEAIEEKLQNEKRTGK